jgi:hypothetical protein
LEQINGKLQQKFATKDFDICVLTSKKVKTDILFKVILDILKNTAPGIVHKCPYSGPHSANNITIPKNILRFLPNGQFTVNLWFNDGVKQLIDVSVEVALT